MYEYYYNLHVCVPSSVRRILSLETFTVLLVILFLSCCQIVLLFYTVCTPHQFQLPSVSFQVSLVPQNFSKFNRGSKIIIHRRYNALYEF